MIPNAARCKLRVGLIREELQELRQAIQDNDLVSVGGQQGNTNTHADTYITNTREWQTTHNTRAPRFTQMSQVEVADAFADIQ